MLSYILKVTLCWAATYLLYHLLLRKETFFRLNRWYLLAVAAVGLLVPAIEIQVWETQSAVVPMVEYLQPITIGVEQLETVIITASSEEAGMDWWLVLTWIYGAGVLFAFTKFGFGLWQIISLRRTSECRKEKGYRFISTEAEHVPFSFFNQLFWSQKFEVEPADREAILRHEEAHIFQKHSFDVIFVELLSVLFWCSPPIYFFKKAVKTNHEYLADEAVLKNASRKNYGRILLRQFRQSPALALSNSIFSSQLKNRITMMTKTKSTRLHTLKYLAGLPIFALLFLAFSLAERPGGPAESEGEKMLVQRDTSREGEVFKVVEEMPRFPGCEDVTDAGEQKACSQRKLLDFIFANLKYPEEAQKNGVDGMVVVNFIVEKDGSVTSAEIKRSIGSGCDEEVLKLMDKMPNWIPGKQKGEPVRVSFNLPIKFKLDPEGEDKKMEVDELPLFRSGCENVAKEERQKCSKTQLVNFIVENLKYPEEAKKTGTEGTVVASFVIDEKGEVTQTKIVKSLDESCDDEVLRILNSMPDWAPGMKNGKPTSVEMKLPFKFALPQDKKAPGWSGEAKNLAKQIEVFKVYPNPATDRIMVSFKTKSGQTILRLSDGDGKTLASQKMKATDGFEQTAIFNTTDLSRGVVYLSLLDDKNEILETAKVILK